VSNLQRDELGIRGTDTTNQTERPGSTPQDRTNDRSNDTIGTPSHGNDGNIPRMEFRFVEFFLQSTPIICASRFWTKPLLYGKFLPVYKEIMGTLALSDKH